MSYCIKIGLVLYVYVYFSCEACELKVNFAQSVTTIWVTYRSRTATAPQRKQTPFEVISFDTVSV